MARASSIRLFLVNGSHNGLRTAEISNWTGKAVAGPRSELDELLKRDELSCPGTYILTGVDAELGERAIYIGEAEDVGKRIKSHKEKDFWNQCVAFVSKDENLTKAHIKYLEGKLLDRLKELGANSVTNSQSSGSRLPESDSAEMDVFLEKVYQLLPILGVNDFNLPETRKEDKSSLYYNTIKGLKATGKRTTNGFTVLKGSEAVLNHRPSAKSSRRMRERLVEKGVLVRQGERFVFSRDFEFGSPSTAGAAVRGGATNGLTSWKNAKGKSIKDVESTLD